MSVWKLSCILVSSSGQKSIIPHIIRGDWIKVQSYFNKKECWSDCRNRKPLLLVAKEKQCHLDLSQNHLKRYLTFGSYPAATLPCILGLLYSVCLLIHRRTSTLLSLPCKRRMGDITDMHIVYSRSINWLTQVK